MFTVAADSALQEGRIGGAGTLVFAAPEMRRLLLQSKEASTEQMAAVNTTALDVYSYGASLYSLLTGSLPPLPGRPIAFPPPPEVAHLPQLQQLITRCLAHDPAQRPDLNQLLTSPDMAWLHAYDGRVAGASNYATGSNWDEFKALLRFYTPAMRKRSIE